MNALFTPIDMTDYENTFVGFDEIGGALPINNPHVLMNNINFNEDPIPPDFLNRDDEDLEKRIVSARSNSHRNQLEEAAAMKEYLANLEEDEDDEDEEEEGDGEEGEEEPVDKLAEYLAAENAYPELD